MGSHQSFAAWLRASPARRLAALAAAVATIAACGSDTSITANVGTDPIPGVPLNWTASANNSANFETGLEGISTHAGKDAAYLHGEGLDASGAIYQRIDATPFRGQRVKATAWVNESFITNAGSFSVSVDAPLNQASSLVSIPAPLGGSDTWHQVFVVFDVPANSVGLTITAAMTGSGQVFFDDIAMAPVDTSVPITTSVRARTSADSATLVTLYTGAHATLLNTDFESGFGAGQ